jgi:hypothetical protein
MGLPNRVRCLLTVGAAAWGLCACVASHDVEGDNQGLGSAGSPTVNGGNGSKGGTGGAGTATGTNSTGSCVAAQCPGGNVFGQALAGCCTSDKKCGVDVSALGFGTGCAEMNAPGAANAACPSSNLSGVFTLEGCCRPDGTCGVLDTFAGLGCTNVGATQQTSCKP